MYNVYELFTNTLVYTGGYSACKRWVLDHCTTICNGNKIFRTWEEDGKKFYDVGKVYYMERKYD